MRIEAVCSECGAQLHHNCSQGESSAQFACSCGNEFTTLVIMEPYGLSYVYGIEALERKRWGDACTHFVTSFELFQKAATALLLQGEGLQPDLANLISADLRLSRENLSQIAKQIIGSKPPGMPNARLRNKAVHRGKVPLKEQAARIGPELLNVYEGWLTPLAARVQRDYDRLWVAYRRFPDPLPADVTPVARGTFDLAVTQAQISERWTKYDTGRRPRTTSRSA